MSRITVLGEALVDLAPAGGERLFRAVPGGSPANVAVGLGRLGVPPSLVTGLGEDAFGRLVVRHLEESDVAVVVQPSRFTGMAIVTLDEAGVPAYDFALSWEPSAAPLPDGTVALHTGSLAAALGGGPAAVEAMMAAARRSATVSFDPNVRPALMGPRPDELARIERQIGLSDVVKASEEDIGWLHPGADPLGIARGWRALGPALVVVTHGSAGATLLGDTEIHRPAPPVKVVDTVGAGDAFMSALLAGLDEHGLLGADGRAGLGGAPAQALERAVLAASLTCTRPGADPPTRADLIAFTPA
ncbi:carbohydrate kinase family protein [Actinomadura rupiterrae]|uniref:carbohydrate kinase family protein n=1 Tax=Actinomadura rupiterrae TaxID=559627 RepID=UPI0026469EF2|nr:carbohydrate kinase [Actinomadura rupiterrae]MCP2341636.1 fructokinase [Actinomadura rupiterrae]